MRSVTDPTEVRRLAEELQDENWAFRAWIKSNSIARINDTFICPIVFNVVEGMKVDLDWYGSESWTGSTGSSFVFTSHRMELCSTRPRLDRASTTLPLGAAGSHPIIQELRHMNP